MDILLKDWANLNHMSGNSKNEHLSKESFLERVARMYYVLGMSQQEISVQLNIGRSSVSRFLNEARERGIVQIQIRSDLDSCRHEPLERKLTKLYGLKDCVVFRGDQGANPFEAMATQYLDSVLPSHGAIGLGWGKTLNAIGTQLHLCDSRPGLKVYQLIGGFGAKEDQIPASSIIQMWAQALRGKAHLFPAPAIAGSAESKESFMKDPSIQEIMLEIRKMETIVFSIGHAGEDSTLLALNLVSGLTYEELSGASVGEILFHCYDKQGKFSLPRISERVVGTSTEDLMNIELRICVAQGAHKVQAISGALQGKLLNVLITTEETALQVLELK
ncbi:sugar-binding transcriptional regulator [Paenibacillus periandrae]|uniref:sugar-binding transcriptional regulator n=1 Tax=Paenibacillus periandrae TaxID=1761741 RepID=UPI001F099138|nr:sugar-binding domain-containing protein [Paenibacillus periandrae]